MRDPVLVQTAASPPPAIWDQGRFLIQVNRGREHVAAGRLDAARECLEQALRLRPGDESALDMLGRIYFKMDMRPQAFTIYRHLVQLHPESDILHANLGILEFKEGRNDDARRRLETALLLNPANPRPRMYLGLIDRRQGHLASCLEHLEAAGAHELARRVRENSGSLGQDVEPDVVSDTDPVPIVRAPAALDLEGALRAWPSLAADDSARLEVIPGSGDAGPERLRVEVLTSARVRTGLASWVVATRGSLRRQGSPAAGLAGLAGRGRLEIPVTGRVALISLEEGQSIHIVHGRLLACSGGLSVSDKIVGLDRGSRDRAVLRAVGPGVLAMACGRSVHAIALYDGPDLDELTAPWDEIVCWTSTVRWLGASGPTDDLISVNRPGAAAAHLGGPGVVVLDPTR